VDDVTVIPIPPSRAVFTIEPRLHDDQSHSGEERNHDAWKLCTLVASSTCPNGTCFYWMRHDKFCAGCSTLVVLFK
jgi:hypothetical protein